MTWIQDVTKPFHQDVYDYRDSLEVQVIESVKHSNDLQNQVNILKDGVSTLKRAVSKATDNFNTLSKKLNSIEGTNRLESTLNNKRRKTNITYNGRPEGKVDPRVFFQPYNSKYPKFTGTDDEKAIKALRWVKQHIVYTSDKKELWQFAHETLSRGKGDCEDGAILLANVLLYNGIPYYKIRINAGSVKGGGHAYTTYYSEEKEDWYILDWCYWYNECNNLQKTWKEAKKYYNIWFSCNTKYCYGEYSK